MRELLNLNEGEPIPILAGAVLLVIWLLFAGVGLWPVFNILYLVYLRIAS
jgi:hypothetical protein